MFLTPDLSSFGDLEPIIFIAHRKINSGVDDRSIWIRLGDTLSIADQSSGGSVGGIDGLVKLSGHDSREMPPNHPVRNVIPPSREFIVLEPFVNGTDRNAGNLAEGGDGSFNARVLGFPKERLLTEQFAPTLYELLAVVAAVGIAHLPPS